MEGLFWLIVPLSILLSVQKIQAEEFIFDFEYANHCSRWYSGATQITDQDKVILEARPRQSDFAGSHDCMFRFVSNPPGRPLRFFNKHFSITDCGVTLEVFDQNRFTNTPKYTLKCGTPPNSVYMSNTGEMTIRLAKVSPISYGYNFDMRITTDQSPFLEQPSDVYRPSVQRSALTDGAIIGISVSCAVAGLIVIGIIVFVIRKKRKMNRESRSEAKERPYSDQQRHY